MFKFLRRSPPVEKAEAVAALWDRFLPKPADLIAPLALFFTGGAGMTYLASITEWLAAWGPVAWGGIGIAFGGAVLLLFAVAGRLRGRRADPTTEARITALGSKIDDLGRDLRDGSAARLEAICKTWDHAFQQLRGRLEALECAREPADGASTSPMFLSAPVGSNLYVGRVSVDTNKLESDFVLEFAFIAFNGSATPLRVARLRGRIAYGGSVDAPDADFSTLPTPAIRDDNLMVFAPSTEFLVVVSQGVPSVLAAGIARRLAAGERVVFAFEKLDVFMAGQSEADDIRLPVWDRVTCERLGDRTVTGRMVMASGAVRIGASDRVNPA